MRLASLLTFVIAFVCVLAAPAHEGTPTKPRTNAEALARGLPILHPSSVLRCPPEGCTPEFEAQWTRRRQRKRAQPSAVVCPPTGPTSGTNLQTYTAGISGILAPPVYGCGQYFYQSGIRYNFLIDAINQSCYVQMDKCQLAANRGGNKEPLTVSNCNGWQIQACLANAKTFAASYKG